MMKFINLTPHDVVIIFDEDHSITIPRSGTIARVKQEIETVFKTFDEIPITENKFGAIENLPEPESNVRYIVSAMVESAAVKNGRKDCLFPCQPVRDESGNIIGCRSLGYTT